MNKSTKPRVKKEKDRTILRLIFEAKKIRSGLTVGAVLAFLVIATNMIAPIFAKEVVDTLNRYWLIKGTEQTFDLMKEVMQPLLLLLSMYVIKAILSYIKMLVMNYTVSRHFTANIRIRMSDKIKMLPVSYIDKTEPGQMLSRITSDVSDMGNTIHEIIDMLIMGVFQVLAMMVMMFIINWQLALVVVGMVPISMALAAIVGGKGSRHFSKERECVEKYYVQLEETYSGYATVKAYGLEPDREKAGADITKEIAESSKKGQILTGMMVPIVTFTSSISYALICLLGGYLAINGLLSLGGVIAILLYSKQFTQPLEQIAQGMASMQRVKASAKRVYEMLDYEEMEVITGDMPKEIEGNVKFENVYFSYSEDKPLIENLNIDIKKGQKVAIVGPTGAGKTTIVNLLMRFYDIQSGHIYIDGIDINTVSRESVRDLFSMVLQDTWLFKGTVFENVRYAKDGATLEEVMEACDHAYADHFIKALPDGYDTELDEGTSNLSGGQKQLLTIARAFLSARELLILDEATSNVDTRTELLIQKAMDKLMKDKTAFVIAHRLSTIVNADLILVIDDGSIVETGTHKTLLEKDGLYAEIYNSQYLNK
ncbi:MAG TPA: ABC transporter ATP-binding protein [Clostridia bacterium]|jgi:ATP-binding cassette subfamily B protein|nr:ABC transporter ATP-binding protein [Clostridia bacterium]